jgi:outer membrane protein OmpA-like peptidoglycan-associated protein
MPSLQAVARFGAGMRLSQRHEGSIQCEPETAHSVSEEGSVVSVRILAAVAMGCVTLSAGAQASVPQRIPLCAGLTIVTAIGSPEGDYESIKRVESVDDRSVHLKLSAQRRLDSTIRNITVYRTVLREDLAAAALYVHDFNDKAARTIPGSTALGISSAVLRSLKTDGAAKVAFVDPVAAAGPVDRNTHPNLYDYQMMYALQRVGTAPVTIPVIVNGAKLELPAIQVRGDYIGDKAQFLFLDDESNPIALRYRFETPAPANANPESLDLQVVKITYRCSSEPAQPSRLERALLETGRVDIYDIYFDFASDRIREESEPTLREIGELMQRHPDWKLAIEGHTDSIASDRYNLELSQRRAGAVRNALVGAHGVAVARLSASGAGESRPKDRNDTLEGRVRNRRVELIRRQ